MHNFDKTADRIHQIFEARTAARDRALSQARTLIRHCANAIRAIHREELVTALEHLNNASQLVNVIQEELSGYPDLYFAGYTQDALKEYAEAYLVYALVTREETPTPEDLKLEYATYIQGLAEAVGELRRRCLDLLLHENFDEARRLLNLMDDIYAVLVTMDYPDAITGGLRRLTDLVRGVTERTHGDVALSMRQQKLEQSLRHFESRLEDVQDGR
jgi:translin